MTARTLRLNAGWSPERDGPARVALVSAARGKRLRIALDRALVEPMLARLAEGVPEASAVDVLCEACGADRGTVTRVLDALERSGALVRRAPADDVLALDGTTLYDRQVRFLSFYETQERSGLELNRALQDRTVVIPGLGGLGGWIALMCARLGIRRIVGIEPDRVELSNLHRQVLYGRGDVGALKVEACARALGATDPDVEFEGHARWIERPADLVPLVRGADLVINPFPNHPAFGDAARSVALGALEAGVPCLQMPYTHCVGPLTVPGETACVECAAGPLDDEHGFRAATDASVPPWQRKGFLAALAPRQAVSAGVAVWEAVRFLSGIERAPTLDGAVWVDLASYRRHLFVETPRRPSCPTCGSAARSGADAAPAPAVTAAEQA